MQHSRSSTLVALVACIVACGCSAGGTARTTTEAGRIVDQADSARISHVSIAVLADAFLDDGEDATYSSIVVDIRGTVAAYGMDDSGRYSILLRDGEKDALCFFDAAVADEFGADGRVHAGAAVGIRGQCQPAGLFAAHPFRLEGCRLIN